MRREQLMIFLPLLGLIILVVILYSPELFSTHIPVLSDLDFDKKTNLTLTFSIAIFAAIEGYATFKRAKMEENRHKIADAQNALEKAFGPLYTLLNKVTHSNGEKTMFWLEFEERKRIDEILAAYPFMFPPEIVKLWQEKIRNPKSLMQTSSFEHGGVGIDMGAYIEFRKMINDEYVLRVKNYHQLIEN